MTATTLIYLHHAIQALHTLIDQTTTKYSDALRFMYSWYKSHVSTYCDMHTYMYMYPWINTEGGGQKPCINPCVSIYVCPLSELVNRQKVNQHLEKVSN